MSPSIPLAKIDDLAGRVLCVGIPEPRLDAGVVAQLEALRPAGIILFARNVESAQQVSGLCASIRDVVDDPLILIDQEGGRVDRLRSWRGRTAAPRELAALGIAATAAEAARTASDLRALGVNFNCVPVVDLDEARDDNGIGDRTLGSDPWDVATQALGIIAAHRAVGVATSLKHFPGLGRTGMDTHHGREALGLSEAELFERELVPFRILLDDCPAIMVSHVGVPAVSGDDTPASLSNSVVEGLLRQRLGYAGLIITDDLSMGAVAHRSPAQQAVEALSAGCDLLLYCMDLAAASAARAAIIEEACRSDRLARRLVTSAGRVQALQHSLA